ncbi:hypothetical protein [Desulfobotulus pelophilus]
MAFKYFPIAAFQKILTYSKNFTLIPKDTEQMAGYVEGLKKEYPEAKISQHVISCFGNKGFRVFDMD